MKRKAVDHLKKYSKKNKKNDDIRVLKNKMEDLLSQIQDIKEEINNIKNNQA